jgi:hypothetical protein
MTTASRQRRRPREIEGRGSSRKPAYEPKPALVRLIPLPLGIGNACSGTVKNDVHWAHEFGHFMGLQHLYPGNNDLLAGTAGAAFASCTDPLNPTNPLWTIIMTLNYNNFHQISPSQARIVRQNAFLRWY